MAQKRTKPKMRDFSNVETFNLFSAFDKSGKIRSKINIADMESDEEEDLEEIKAKMKKTTNGKGKGRSKGKANVKGRNRYLDSDEDDEVVAVKKNDQNSRPDSPSPPPSPEFDDRMVAEIMNKNWKAAQDIQNLESSVRTYQINKAQDLIFDSISPVKGTPSAIHVIDDEVARNTITVKVRSRNGLLRFENYGMNATFEELFDKLASMEDVDHSLIRVTRKSDDILEKDTPESVHLHVADILDYVIVEGSAPAILSYSLLDEEDFVVITLRTHEKRSDMSRKVAKMDTLQKVFEEFAATQKKPIESLKFLFDGDVISGKNTPQELDMDEENAIDVQILR